MSNIRYIAHKTIIDGKEEYQSIYDHCKNTAEIARDKGDSNNIGALAYLAGRLHDAGKYSTEFQKYIKGNTPQIKGSVIHSIHGAHIVNDASKRALLKRALLSETNLKEQCYINLTAQILRIAIMSHHELKDIISLKGEDIFGNSMTKIQNNYQTVCQNLYSEYSKEDIDKDFSKAVEDIKGIYKMLEVNNTDGDSYYFTLGLYVRMLISILIDADRIDTTNFNENKKYVKNLSNAVDTKWQKFIRYSKNNLKMFNTDESVLNKYRNEISDSCKKFACKSKENVSNGIYCLSVPCGAGKTLSVFRYALYTALRYHKKRIFYVAPYNSILDQNVKKLAEYIGDSNAVLPHYSNVISDNKYNNKYSEEEYARYKLLVENWDNIDTPVIATSAVQFLNSLFDGDTASVRRMQALKDSVIIIDEVQALPIEHIKLFTGAINVLSKYFNASVVLCTATQPVYDQISQLKMQTPINIILPYIYNDVFKRVKFENCMAGQGFSIKQTAEFIFEKSNDVKSVLTIVNTKRAAREITKQVNKLINDNYVVYHLSTNMCPAHRINVINRMIQDLNEGKKKVICVSTSLIEAGVDISFEHVIRSLTGLDKIIQAAGRCNRNFEKDFGIVSIIKISECNEKSKIECAVKNAEQLAFERIVVNNNVTDVFSGKNLESYYKTLFEKNKNFMDYKINQRLTLLDLLIDPKKIILAGNTSASDSIYNLYFSQCFKTAGKEFQVIDDTDQISVVVPYGKTGKNLIQQLKTNTEYIDRSLITKLQNYTIQIRKSDYENNIKSIDCLDNLNIHILRPDKYAELFGFNTDQ